MIRESYNTNALAIKKLDVRHYMTIMTARPQVPLRSIMMLCTLSPFLNFGMQFRELIRVKSSFYPNCLDWDCIDDDTVNAPPLEFCCMFLSSVVFPWTLHHEYLSHPSCRRLHLLPTFLMWYAAWDRCCAARRMLLVSGICIAICWQGFAFCNGGSASFSNKDADVVGFALHGCRPPCHTLGM